MTSVPSTGANSGTGNSSSPTDALQRLNTNYEDFLKLLTTQLQNQDPTAPTDTNQLTQEIASLSQVEQQISTNQNLQKLIDLFGVTQMNNSVSYIGKQIDAKGNQGNLAGGVALFAYDLPAGASSAKVTITDGAGRTVFSGDGTTIAGRNQVYWDGTNSVTGEKMPDGTYNIAIDAKDATGKSADVTTYTTGLVSSVDTQDGTMNLMIGNIAVPLTDVKSVRGTGA